MKLFFSGLFTLSLLLASLIFTGCDSMTGTPAPPPDTKTHIVAKFNYGDTVSVSFSGTLDIPPPHEEIIKEDGTITLPWIGAVQAVGKTAGELQTEIHDLYVPKYYVRLTVTVKAGDLIYYVRGEVKTPGREIYVGETTVTKAIASAGDFTDFANHTVSLTRANGQIIKVDVDKASENSTLDLQVYPGDQIVVPRRIF
jgi:protein involved in polysaccharide export with SLBB domain